MTQLRMAKSTPQEMERMLKFFQRLEAMIESEEFDYSPFDDYDEALKIAVGTYVVNEWDEFISFAWPRFYWGFDTLLRNVADPDLNYLDWKPELKSKLEKE